MLKEKIDNFYLNQKQDRKKQSLFYVSDAGKCPRQVFFNFRNAPKANLDPRMARVFSRGTKFHNDLFSLFYQLPDIKVMTEIHIPTNDLVTGRADAIILMDNKHWVVDIKSMNSMIFKGLKYPKPENVAQLQLYLHFFSIKNGILFYIDKDRQEIKEFIVNYDPVQVHYLLTGFRKLKKQIDDNKVPPVLLDYPKSWMCRYCRFSEICKTIKNAQEKT